MSVIDTLITDRTLADVSNRTSKGSYNASDLNRVGKAMIYVADRLRGAGYDVSVNPRVNWTDAEWVSPAHAAQLLADLAALREQFAQASGTPDVPADMEGLTYEDANDIEKMLQAVDGLLTNIMVAWFYSGEVYSGEV